jgi:hypothetical protein
MKMLNFILDETNKEEMQAHADEEKAQADYEDTRQPSDKCFLQGWAVFPCPPAAKVLFVWYGILDPGTPLIRSGSMFG